jgi:hypothetical protein
MNIKKGLFRIWVVISALWLVSEGIVQLGKLKPYPPHSMVTAAIAKQAIDDALAYKFGYMSQVDCKAKKELIENGDLQYTGTVDCAALHKDFNPFSDFAGSTGLNPTNLRVRDCSNESAIGANRDHVVDMVECVFSVTDDTDSNAVVNAIQTAESYQRVQASESREKALVILLVPPLALLILWWVSGWIVKGFKPDMA